MVGYLELLVLSQEWRLIETDIARRPGKADSEADVALCIAVRRVRDDPETIARQARAPLAGAAIWVHATPAVTRAPRLSRDVLPNAGNAMTWTIFPLLQGNSTTGRKKKPRGSEPRGNFSTADRQIRT